MTARETAIVNRVKQSQRAFFVLLNPRPVRRESLKITSGWKWLFSSLHSSLASHQLTSPIWQSGSMKLQHALLHSSHVTSPKITLLPRPWENHLIEGTHTSEVMRRFRWADYHLRSRKTTVADVIGTIKCNLWTLLNDHSHPGKWLLTKVLVSLPLLAIHSHQKKILLFHR